ncbi:MAG: fatty acid hydroxylase [Saprospiraceae bacterium]|nr:sterol desaturase family protein [Bacteroidia bacterium]NNE15977.1 fatty acid hydroxylase [Saprospiraceae bacterium]
MNVKLSEGHEIISNKDESVQLFKSKFLDTFSRVKWYVPLILFIPIIGYFIYSSFTNYAFSIGQIAMYYIGGLAIWTIVEYLFHRFIFHYVPKSKLGRKLHFMMHGVHHAYPNDSLRLVMPPAMSIPLSTGFYFIFKLSFGGLYAPIFAGFLTGYLAYDMLHYATHHAKFIKGKWFDKLKHHHMRHHFQDPDNGFGVSSAVWDRVFNTGYKK